MAMGSICWYLTWLCAALPGSLAICRHPSGECVDGVVEDASVLLQKHALASNIEDTQSDETAAKFEPMLLEDEVDDDSDLDLNDESKDEEPAISGGDGSKEACIKCKRGLDRRAIIGQCRKDFEAVASKGKRAARGAIRACFMKTAATKCKDDCTYGTPCEQCQREVNPHDLRDVKAKCVAKAKEAMKALCADKCSHAFVESEVDEDGVESEEDEDGMLYSDADRLIGGRNGSFAACHNCARRDHNFHILKACQKKIGSDKSKNLARLACIGDGIASKCKEACTFGTPCDQCKRDAVLSRKTRAVQVGMSSCLDAGRKSFCPDKCAGENGGAAAEFEEHLVEDEVRDASD